MNSNYLKDFALVLTAIDLFAGAGGLSEGLEAEGIAVPLALELHPQAALTYALNHPDTAVVAGDIRLVSERMLSLMVKRHCSNENVDLIVGGPPCQGFSSAGKKQLDDPRNNLFLHFCRVVAAVKPKVIVFENVPGFKKAFGGRIFEAALKSFGDLGYDIHEAVINAADYGVPQNRQRFILIGTRRSLGLKFFWPEITHSAQSSGLFDNSFRPLVTVNEALSDLEFVGPGYEGHRHMVAPQSDFQRARRRNNELLFNHLATQHRPKAVEMFKHIREGGTISGVPKELRSAKRTMARLDRSSVSNAVLALPDDLIHYAQDRIPTVREMARLQSFDDDYVFMGKRTSGFIERKVDVPQYTQVGNSVPPLLARAIAKSVLRMLGIKGDDVRNIHARHLTKSWIRGSSARAGYTLDTRAELQLYNVDGGRLPLPIDATAPRVSEARPLVEWAAAPRSGLKRQWLGELTAA